MVSATALSAREIPPRDGGNEKDPSVSDQIRFRYAFGMSLPVGDTQLVQIMDAALADAAHRAGDWLACRPGCTQCCHGAFAINALDVARLQTGMSALRESDPSRVRPSSNAPAHGSPNSAPIFLATQRPACLAPRKTIKPASKTLPTTHPAQRSIRQRAYAMSMSGAP